MAILRPGDIIGPTLDKYHAQVTKDINAASKDAADKLTKKLKRTGTRPGAGDVLRLTRT